MMMNLSVKNSVMATQSARSQGAVTLLESKSHPLRFEGLQDLDEKPFKREEKQKTKLSLLKRLGLPLAAMAAALGITGCQSEVGKAQKAYEQIQTQPEGQKIDFLRLKICDENEDVRVFALKEAFRLPGHETVKASFVLKALQIEGVHSYQEAKNYLEQNLYHFSFQDQSLQAKLLKLVEVAPKVNSRQSVIWVPMIIGKTTILQPRTITHHEKEHASQAFQKLAQGLRQELAAR